MTIQSERVPVTNPDVAHPHVKATTTETRAGTMGTKKEHAAINIVLVVYGAMEHNDIMQVRTAVDTTCRSTLPNVKAWFFIQKLVLELTQSIQHTGTRTVHEVRERTRTPDVHRPNNYPRNVRGTFRNRAPGLPPLGPTPITQPPPRGSYWSAYLDDTCT